MDKKTDYPNADTVAELMAFLATMPPNAKVYAYEGEVIGVVVCDPETGKEIGFCYAVY